MKIVLTLLAAIAGISIAGDVEANSDNPQDITPAKPMRRAAPDYPAKCAPGGDAAVEDQTVVIIYDITENGLPENVRVRESTDSCFEEAAIASIRGAQFEPQKVDGRAKAQEDLETTFTFTFDSARSAAAVEDYDARPLLRIPPKYPRQCMDIANSTESVFIEFDVNEKGLTDSVKVVESTLKCLEPAALQSVAQWTYTPKTVNGVPQRRNGVQTVLTFELQGYGVARAPQDIVRRTVWVRLAAVRSALLKERSPQSILSQLEELETKYGAEFTKAEMIAFHHLRAAARLAANDKAGALDDLRIIQKSGMQGERMRESVSKIVQRLEAELDPPETEIVVPADEGQH